MPEQTDYTKHVAYRSPRVAVLETRFKACPDCGDSLQTRRVPVPDHGWYQLLVIGWCPDCCDLKDWAVFVDSYSPEATRPGSVVDDD